MKQLSIILVMVFFLAGMAQAVETPDVTKITPAKPMVLDKAKAVKVEILQVTYPATGVGKEWQFTYENKKIKVIVRLTSTSIKAQS